MLSWASTRAELLVLVLFHLLCCLYKVESFVECLIVLNDASFLVHLGLVLAFLLIFLVGYQHSADDLDLDVRLHCLLTARHLTLRHVFLTFIHIVIENIRVILTGEKIVLFDFLLELVIEEVFFLLLVSQITWWAYTHFVERELTWWVIHDTNLFTFIILCVDHVYFVTAHIIPFGAAKCMCFIHLIAILENAKIVAVWGNSIWSWRVREWRHPLMIAFVVHIERLLLNFVFVAILERLIVEVSSIQLGWPASLIARILLVLQKSLARAHRFFSNSFGFVFVLSICCHSVQSLILWIVRHASSRVGRPVLGLNDLSSIVLMAKNLIVKLLLLSSALWSIPLSYTLLLELVVQQLILLEVVRQRKIKLNLLVLLIVVIVIRVLNLKIYTQIFLLFINALSRHSCNSFGHFRRMVRIDLVHVLGDLIWLQLGFSFRLRLYVLGAVACHGEQWNSCILIRFGDQPFLRCSLCLDCIFRRRGSHWGPRVLPSLGHMSLWYLLSLQRSDFLLL